MTVKTYQAYSMAEALAAVRRDLGIEALIITTRAFKRGGILGLGRQTIIEVTATSPAPPSLPVSRTTTKPRSRRRVPRSSQTHRHSLLVICGPKGRPRASAFE